MASNEPSSETSSLSDGREMEVEEELVSGSRSRGRSRGRGSRSGRGNRVGRGRHRGRGSRGESREPGGRGRVIGSTTRGRSRSRGSLETVVQSDKERVRNMREKRKDEAKEMIRRVSVERLRAIVLELIDREPGLVFDLCEEDSAPSPAPPTPGTTSPDWCKCSHCREMPTDLERKCCGALPRNCVSVRDEMDRLVLDPQVLAIGQRYHRDMLGLHNQQIDNYHKSMRNSGYRNFILWRHRRLGAGQRRVIPSCCVWRIRDEFPSPGGQYTGFIPGRYV